MLEREYLSDLFKTHSENDVEFKSIIHQQKIIERSASRAAKVLNRKVKIQNKLSLKKVRNIARFKLEFFSIE